MLLSIVLLAGQQSAAQPASPPPAAPQSVLIEAEMVRYRAATAASIPCRKPQDENEITVCGLRDADRYRVPFVTRDAGREAYGERLRRLQDTAPPKCGSELFFRDCGKIAVGVTITAAGTRVVLRDPAP